jgi:hypothetical protein
VGDGRKMSFKKSLGKSVVLLLIILILVIGGLLWFDYLGVVQVKSLFSPVYKLLGKTPQSSVTATQTAPLSANLDEDRLRKQKEAGLYNIMLYIEVLKKDFGIIIPQEEIDNLYKIPGNVGRPQLALLLIKLGYCKEVEECFKKYLIHAYDKVRSVKRGITAEQGIELITNAGGVPIIAHPNSLKLAYKELKDYIIYLKSIGLQGLETEHPNLSMEERYVYHEFCKEIDLLESGGTDYHGIDVKPDIEIGSGRNGNIYIPEHSLSLTKQIKSRYM